MGLLTVDPAAGEGSQQLSGAWENVIDVFVAITSVTNPTTRLVGTAEPRGIWGAGWVGLGYAVGDGGVSFPYTNVFWQSFVHFTGQDLYLPMLTRFNTTYFRLFWRFKDGITAHIEVAW